MAGKESVAAAVVRTAGVAADRAAADGVAAIVMAAGAAAACEAETVAAAIVRMAGIAAAMRRWLERREL